MIISVYETQSLIFIISLKNMSSVGFRRYLKTTVIMIINS